MSTCIVTGAAAGIGRAIAERLGRHEDTRLVLLDRDIDGLRAWVAEQPPQAQTDCHRLDIADRGAVQALFNDLAAQLGEVQVLVNCAGICDENEPEDIDTFRRVIDVNLHGSFQVTACCLPLMPGPGRIINMASILGRAGKLRNTGYCASKHAIVGMTKGLALDLAPRRITVNAILPAWVDTPMLGRELAAQACSIGLTEQQGRRNAMKRLPLKRFIAGDEIAALVEWLIGPDAGAITAQSLVVDGGVGLGM
jgi:NAD(P)-dependent dehydrogenase (short-subunit alcohol dehydrogenase family)